MKLVKNVVIIFGLIVLMALVVSKQPDLPDPGITTDNPLLYSTDNQ